MHPAFRGSLQPDVSFFGFDLTVDAGDRRPTRRRPGYFIVIQEQPTEPRFGFDVGTTPARRTHLHSDRGAAGRHRAGPTCTWGRNAAHMAGTAAAAAGAHRDPRVAVRAKD